MKYGIEETDQFLNDLEEAAIWILLNNIEQSEAFAESKVEELRADLDSLIERLKTFPESGESDQIRGIRRFPIYGGRYSAKWIVNHATRTITLLTLSDSKYPKSLRQFQFDE